MFLFFFQQKDFAPMVEEKIQLSKAQKVKNALFEDEETAKLLQELLQSKDPFELQLANKLIKSMVKDVSILKKKYFTIIKSLIKIF